MQGRQRSPGVQALTKWRKYEDSVDLKVSLRVARANGVGDFSRLMLGITRARLEGSQRPPPQLGVFQRHAAAGARARPTRDLLSVWKPLGCTLDMAPSGFEALAVR